MTTLAKKINLSVAAVAMVGAAVLAPSIAQATPSLPLAPTADADDDAGVGSAAGKSPRRAARGAAERDAAGADTGTPSARAGASATGSNPLLQNSLWWFGTPNPNPPAPLFPPRTFEPLASLPGWSLPSYGWYRNLNFEACVLGLGTTITPSVGPYGTSTNSVSTGGC